LDALRGDSEKLYVEDLAAAAHVHPRTLLRAFHQIFRMGPVGYLRYRQLSQLRFRLCDPHGMRTVTEIMQSVGASDMGRLSGAYRKIFDETPSETLRARKSNFR
jgi:AraC family ethanolamine operon transcriptional activator